MVRLTTVDQLPDVPSYLRYPYAQRQAKVKSSESLLKHRDEIRSVVAANHAKNARVFGSMLRGTDHEGSDLDLLVDPTDETTLFDIARIKGTLEMLLGIKVDVITPKALPERFRSRVLAEAAPV